VIIIQATTKTKQKQKQNKQTLDWLKERKAKMKIDLLRFWG